MNAKLKKHTSILLITLLIIGLLIPYLNAPEKAYALTEKITSYSNIVVGSGSNTFSFKIGGKVGICMQADGNPAVTGQACTMYAYANSATLAKLAYLAKTTYGFDTNKKKYIVSRAASYIAGHTPLNNYLYHEEVNSLVSKAKGAVSVPDTFIAYRANPTNGGQDILCWGTRDNGYIKVTKGRNLVAGISSGYPVLTGAKYTATSSTGKTVKTMTVTSSGVSNTITVPVGTYKVKETTAPAGYKLDPTTYTITVTDGATDNVSSKDTPKAGKARLQTKSTMPEISDGNSNYSLAGADFAVYNSKDVKVGTFTTTASGASNTLALLAGTYTIKQTGAAKGYKIRTEVLSFTVTDGATKEAPVNQVPITATLKLVRKSEVPAATDNNPEYSLAGAKYKVMKEKTTTILGNLTTDETGTSNTLTLPLNNYTVEETTVSKGFKPNDTPLTAAFTTSKTAITLNIIAKPKDYEVEYKANGGTGTMANQPFFYNETKALTPNAFTKNSRTRAASASPKFLYWTLKADGSGERFKDKQQFNGLKYAKASKVPLYAQWNTLPEIKAPVLSNADGNKVPAFLKTINGKETLVIQKGDKFTATNYQTASDKEDGDLTNKVTVTKNIPLQDEKAYLPGSYEVTYLVTDSVGDTDTKTITVLVNDPPKVESPDRYFYLGSEMSEAILFEQLVITDKEDGSIPYSKESVELLSIDGKPNVTFDTKEEGAFEVAFKVKDSLKAETEGTFKVNVIEDVQDLADRVQCYPRYINLDGLKYLDANSIWVTDTDYNKALVDSLMREEPLYTYQIK